MSTAVLYQAVLPPHRGSPLTPVETFASPDRTFGVSADRVKILAGRMFNPRAAGQAMIDQRLAGPEHLRPGGTLHLLLIPNNPRTGTPAPKRASPFTFRVSAIVAFDSQIVPATAANSEPTALLSTPFAGTAAAASANYGIHGGVRLRPGASMARFLSAPSTLAKRNPATGGRVVVVSAADQIAATERAIRPEGFALALFAAWPGSLHLPLSRSCSAASSSSTRPGSRSSPSLA
jgi:hypothetical protein